MKGKLNSIIFSHIRINRFKYLASLIFLFAGIIAGAVASSHAFAIDDKSAFLENFFSTYKQDNASFANVFVRAFIQNVRAFLLIWVSGRFIWLVPLNFIELSSKGFGLGYTISYLSLSCGGKGFLLSLFSLIIQNIILIPTLLVFSVLQLNFSVNKYKLRASNSAFRQKRRLIQNDLYLICIVIFIVIICSLIDTCIVPHIIIPIFDSLF